jgi:alpha-2-macroglobulin
MTAVRVRNILFGVLLVAAGSSCGRGDSRVEEKPPQVSTTAPNVEKSMQIDVESLSPVIREIGHADGLPEKVVFEFARPLVAGPGDAGADTQVKVTPAVPGALRFLGPSSLAFFPAKSFAFGTEYTLMVESVQSPAGRLTPLVSKPWVYTESPRVLRRLVWLTQATMAWVLL